MPNPQWVEGYAYACFKKRFESAQLPTQIHKLSKRSAMGHHGMPITTSGQALALRPATYPRETFSLGPSGYSYASLKTKDPTVNDANAQKLKERLA